MVLKTIILQTSEGIPLFARSLVCSIGVKCVDFSKDSTFDDETVLKSGLLTALLTINDVKSEEFKELDIDRSKILSYPKKQIIAVFEVSPQDEVEPLKNRLKLMSEIFETKYEQQLNNFSGEISVFDLFEDELRKSKLLEEGEEFMKNCIDCKYSKHCSFRITTGPFYKDVASKFASIKPSNIFLKMKIVIRGMLPF
ncbi:MAG: hypothetical protein OEZ01_12415 [Candidatus Heimdallarchaeota archaeon]|nr:hypothetical protein [Candidatus Heimdallarchaeota archaeon]MDH5646809.1 hypothetical protein [Candidatus Heimdallarchaeota archaeon]